MHIDELPTPALLLDYDVLEHNLASMQRRCEKLGVRLRPHIKTHKCIEIAKRQRELGAEGITVSTFYEAEAFASAGFHDITWAFPIPLVYTPKVLALPDHVTLRVLVDSREAITYLRKACQAAGKKLPVWLKVDCGYHRAGVDPESPYAEELVRMLIDSDYLDFNGIISHSGYAYNAHTRVDIAPYAEQERTVMTNFAEAMRSKGLVIPAVSVGSTPALWVVDNLDGVDEVRPGNYVFNDYTQAVIGSCSVSDCALTVLASVISHQPGGKHFLTDAGALALSKDVGPVHAKNDMGMGILYENYKRKRMFAHLQLVSLSQEHGKVVADDGFAIEGKFQIGDRVRILEHHACLTAANFDRYYVTRNDEVVAEWKIVRGRS